MTADIKMTAEAYIASFAPSFGSGSNLIGFMRWACKESPVPLDTILDEDAKRDIYLHFSSKSLRTVKKLLVSAEASGLLDAVAAERKYLEYFRKQMGDALEEEVRTFTQGRTKNALYLFLDELATFYFKSIAYPETRAGLSHGYVVKGQDDGQ